MACPTRSGLPLNPQRRRAWAHEAHRPHRRHGLALDTGVLPGDQRAGRREPRRPRLRAPAHGVARLRRGPAAPDRRRLGRRRAHARGRRAQPRAFRSGRRPHLHQPHAPGRRRRRGRPRGTAAAHRRLHRGPGPGARLDPGRRAGHVVGDGGGLLRRPAGQGRPGAAGPRRRRPGRDRPGDLRGADPGSRRGRLPQERTSRSSSGCGCQAPRRSSSPAPRSACWSATTTRRCPCSTRC